MTSRASIGVALIVTSVLTAGSAFAADFVPWRKMKVLSDPSTRLMIEGEKGKLYRFNGSASSYFLAGERAGPAVNICKAIEEGQTLLIRCDRKGGFHDRAQPRPWWWRYEAIISDRTVKIISVAQKDGPFERGESVVDHFHDDVEEQN